MKQIVFILFCLLSICSFGQNWMPNEGENIIFYPLNDNYIENGYDCFYSASQVIKDNKYSFKAKNRFKRNNLGVTSSSEIEGYSFYVQKKELIMNKDKDVLLYFLRRIEDGEDLILRIPLFYDKKSNIITQNFIRTSYETDTYRRKKYLYHVILPFINIDTLSSIKKHYANKKIVYGFKSRNIMEYEYLHDKECDLRELSRSINPDFYEFEFNQTYECKEFVFSSISGTDIYKRLCARILSPSGKEIFMPICYWKYDAKFNQKQNGFFVFLQHFFCTKEEYLMREFKKNKCEDIVEKFTGKKVYYGINKKYNYNKGSITSGFNAYENRNVKSGDLYILNEGAYDCLGFDIFKRFDKRYFDYLPYALLKDSAEVIFKVPVVKIPCHGTAEGDYLKSNYCEKFENYFVLLDEAIQIKEKRSKEAFERQISDTRKREKLLRKYGAKYADYLMMQKDEIVKRFESLVLKYGKENAKLIIEKKVRIGWSARMCEESWGIPDDINTTTGIWGIHEQWIYEYSYGSYYNMKCLYFKNGILKVIQD